MQTQLKQEFEGASCAEHPFVKELYRKARNAAKTYDKTVENQQKAKEGYKLTNDQKEKVKNLENYKRSVLESIETLQLFDKHYQDQSGETKECVNESTAPEPTKESKRDDWLDDIDDNLDEEPPIPEPVKKQKWVPKKKAEKVEVK